MTKTQEPLPICPACRMGHLHPATRIRAFEPHGKHVEVVLKTSVCDVCGTQTTRASQHRENLQALAQRKEHYDKLLMGEEILSLRKRYGLTQQQASKIFGKGKIAFSRYECEKTYPDETTTKLLVMAIKKPDVMKDLADQAGIELPLWSERCEDAQHVKVRNFKLVQPAITQRMDFQGHEQNRSMSFIRTSIAQIRSPLVKEATQANWVSGKVAA